MHISQKSFPVSMSITPFYQMLCYIFYAYTYKNTWTIFGYNMKIFFTLTGRSGWHLCTFSVVGQREADWQTYMCLVAFEEVPSS